MTTVSVFEQLRTRLLSQQWFNTLLYGMPRPVRWALRAAYFASLDFADYLSGRRDPIIPPRRINFTGAVTDLQASREQLKQGLISMAELNSTSRVLELGCGFGRLGIRLLSRPESHSAAIAPNKPTTTDSKAATGMLQLSYNPTRKR